MGALIIALIPLLGGTSLASLTLAQWAAIAAAIAGIVTPLVEDALKPQVQKELSALHPVFAKMFEDVISVGPQQAAANAYAFDFEAPNNPGMFDFIWRIFK